MKIVLALLAISATFALSSVPVYAQDASDAPAGSADNGHKILLAKGCWECHGTGGQGTGAGPQLGPKVLPFEAFIYQLRHPGTDMPPYEEAIISNAEAADIYAYLKTQKAFSAKDIPLLK